MRTAVVIIASTRAAAAIYPDRTGPLIAEWLTARGFQVTGPQVVADGPDVEQALRQAVGADVLITASYQVSFEGFAARGLDAPTAAAERRLEDGEDERRPLAIEQSEGGFVEGLAHARQFTRNFAHSGSSLPGPLQP